MQITSLADHHLDAALELWAATEYLGPVPRDEVQQLRTHAPDLVLAAVEGERVLGVVLGSFDGRRGWISRLAVAADARRRGIGQALVKELEDRLAAIGCRRVNLLVFGGNEAGRAFWERLGYDGFEGIVMYGRTIEDDAAGPSC